MRKYLPLATLVLSLLLAGTQAASAELRLAHIFNDHVVLQRARPVHVWGWADPGSRVHVHFSEHTAQAKAGADGTWSVTLSPMAASAKGSDLKVESGKVQLLVRDVVVGEVWHASGQSNMAMTVGAMVPELEKVKEDIATADMPAIRFCRINEPESTEPLSDLRRATTWTPCAPRTAANVSGVAFYFARRLHQELKVPIGILDTSRGGTPIEPYIPLAAFDAHPTLRRERELGQRGDLEALWKLPGGVRARDANWLPGRLFHARLAPIARFSVRGAIWYQGESNCGDQEDPRDYQHKMRALVRGWRDAFGDENMPVYFVQLPGSGAREGWPYLREQQRLAADLPHTGLVVTIDLDGAGIHPANKIDIGHRLANWALAKEYDQPIAFSGPMFDRQEIKGEQIVLHFRQADSGLMLADKDGIALPHETPDAILRHFEIADESGTWHPATAHIAGQTVVVTSAASKTPIAVRYAYAVSPQNCNLYNRDGLPAAPFFSRPDLLDYDPQLPK